jgi:hypothetical protein
MALMACGVEQKADAPANADAVKRYEALADEACACKSAQDPCNTTVQAHISEVDKQNGSITLSPGDAAKIKAALARGSACLKAAESAQPTAGAAAVIDAGPAVDEAACRAATAHVFELMSKDPAMAKTTAAIPPDEKKSEMEDAVKACLAKTSPADLACVMAATDMAAVHACDAAHRARTAAASPDGGPAPTGPVGGPKIDAMLDKLDEFATKICACKDVACVSDVQKQMTDWSAQHKSEGTPDAAQTARASTLMQKVADCSAKVPQP